MNEAMQFIGVLAIVLFAVYLTMASLKAWFSPSDEEFEELEERVRELERRSHIH
jgi:hypothetical protein